MRRLIITTAVCPPVVGCGRRVRFAGLRQRSALVAFDQQCSSGEDRAGWGRYDCRAGDQPRRRTDLRFADADGHAAGGGERRQRRNRTGFGRISSELFFSAFLFSRGLTNFAPFGLCKVAGQVVSCTLPAEFIPEGLTPYENFEMHVGVKITGAVSEGHVAEVSGGGAPPVRFSAAGPGRRGCTGV